MWILSSVLRESVSVCLRPFAGYPQALYEKGVKIITIGQPHHLLAGLRPGIKSTSFQRNILIKMQAQQAGADDAVMLDARGYVTEGTSSNLFIVKGGRLITPSSKAEI